MVLFSVPADFELNTLEKIQELNESCDDCRVNEVYGQITSGRIKSSGRLTDVLTQVDENQLEQYVKQAKNLGIEFNYTLNPSCYGNKEFSKDGIKEIIELLHYLWDIRIRNLTIALPSLIEIVNSTGLDFTIKASAICEINTPSKAKFYKDLGVQRLVVDADVTRDFDKLGNICKVFGNGVEVIVNNVCRKSCTYKMFHYNHEAHCTTNSTQTIIDYYATRCLLQHTQNIESYIKTNWVRPEDLHFYEDCGIKHFKIQGRQNLGMADLVKTLQAYSKRSYEGNLYELITLFSTKNVSQVYIDNKKLDHFVDKFYKDSKSCNELCDECGYCLKYAKNSIDIKVTERMSSMSKRILNLNDKFKQMLEICNEETNSKEKNI